MPDLPDTVEACAPKQSRRGPEMKHTNKRRKSQDAALKVAADQRLAVRAELRPSVYCPASLTACELHMKA